MRFSASRLKTYMECQLQAKYRYEDNLPRRQNAAASFGTIAHKAIQTYYESGGDYERAVKTFKGLWANPARAGVEPEYWPKRTSFGSYMGRGLEMLKQLHASHAWQTFHLIACEQPFLVPFGKYELTGFIDLLGVEKSGTGTELLKIIDFKTSSRTPSTAALALDVQFTTYHYAVNQREFWVGVEGNPEFNGIVNGEWLWETIGRDMQKRCIWWALNSGRQIDAGPRVERDHQRLYRVCSEIEKSIDAGVAVPKIGEACNWCDFQEPCALEIPVSINALSDKTDTNRWI